MVTGLLCALAIGAPAGDRLLMIQTLNCQDWAQLANQYIAMGEKRASAELIERSRRNQVKGDVANFNTRTCLMARLLFEPNEKEPLRPPFIGALPLPYRSMPVANWPLYPFAKQNGVLFLFSENYSSDKVEPCESYLRFLHENGHFRKQPYKVPTFEESKVALKKLLANPHWKSIQWSFTSPNESYTISPILVTSYLAKQTVPTDY